MVARGAVGLANFARRQVGCQALQRHYGIGWLCAAIAVPCGSSISTKAPDGQ
jgi:hypothetical protein